MSVADATARTAQRTTPDQREPYVDNLKAVLIALVVVGHTVGQFVDAAPGAGTLYTLIYLFHMPAFVLLCGVLTTSPDLSGRRVDGMIRTLVLPFVVFQVLYAAFFSAAGRMSPWDVDGLITPIYHLWFLVALFAWRLVAPFLARVRAPVAVVSAVALSLAAGLSQVWGPGLAFDRVVSFLPFFAIGLVMGKRAFRLPSTARARVVAAATLALSVPAAATFHDQLGRGWLFWRGSYRALEVTVAQGMTIRLGMVLWALALTAAVFVLVPRHRTFLTVWGERSMYPYLLHAFVVQAFGWSQVEVTTAWQFAGALVGAVGLTALLATGPVRLLFRPLVEPRGSWLLRPAAPPVAAPAPTR